MENRSTPKGRGSHGNPPNRFEKLRREADFEHLSDDEDLRDRRSLPLTEYFTDRSRSIVTENDSPDVGFRYSVNPYRGCSHGCSYCYARPTHEYLGLTPGWTSRRRSSSRKTAAGAFPRLPVPEEVEAGSDRPVRRHRPLSTRGSHFQLTRRLLEVGGRSLAADYHHHQERLGSSRPRPCIAPHGRIRSRPRQHERHDAGRRRSPGRWNRAPVRPRPGWRRCKTLARRACRCAC